MQCWKKKYFSLAKTCCSIDISLSAVFISEPAFQLPSLDCWKHPASKGPSCLATRRALQWGWSLHNGSPSRPWNDRLRQYRNKGWIQQFQAFSLGFSSLSLSVLESSRLWAQPSRWCWLLTDSELIYFLPGVLFLFKPCESKLVARWLV